MKKATKILFDRIRFFRTEQQDSKKTKVRLFSNSTISALATLLSAIATCFTAYLIFEQKELSAEQNRISEIQTQIQQAQTKLIEKQTQLFEQQNIQIDSQNVLFGRQNELVDIQNTKSDAQIALIGSQNKLLNFQNQRISQQTNLQEAERRSSLVYLFSNVLDKIDEELKERENKGEKRYLSVELIARIASLTQALKPYKYLNNDTIIERAVSPEKGQLLSALINFNLAQSTYDSIFKKSNFQNLELQHSFLENTTFNKINLANSVLWNCNLSKSIFKDSNLENVILNFSNLSNSKFISSNLDKSSIQGVIGEKSKFLGCSLNEVKFTGSNLKESIFSSTQKFSLEFGEILFGELSNTSKNLIQIKSFHNFGLVYGVETTYRDTQNKKRYYHYIMRNMGDGDMKEKKVLSVSVNNSPFKIKKTDFSFTDFTNARFENYMLVDSNFKESIITGIEFSNSCIWKTYFDNVKLDSQTFEKNFKFQIDPKIAPIGAYYNLIPQEPEELFKMEIVGATINSSSSKRPYSHILKLKTKH